MLAIPFRFVHLVLSPLVGIVTRISNSLLELTGKRKLAGPIFGTRSELRWVMAESAQNLTSEERAMIGRVLDLQAFTVGSVTVPLSKVISVSTRIPLAEVMKICRERQVTRLPAWEQDGSERRLVGIVSLERFFTNRILFRLNRRVLMSNLRSSFVRTFGWRKPFGGCSDVDIVWRSCWEGTSERSVW
jgi:CBS domain containing-hemolysin-like protein